MQALIMVGVNLLLSAALWGIGMLLRRPTNTVQGEIKNREIQISTYGATKPILYGQCKTAMELIYAKDLERVDVTTEVGKGGGNTVTQVYYLATFAGMWGIAPDPAVFGTLQLLKMYCDDKLMFNALADDDKVVKQSKWVAKKFKFYSGQQTLPDPVLEEELGAGNVPAYKNKCYGRVVDYNVINYGNRIPTMRAVVAPGTAAAYGFYPVTGAAEYDTAPYAFESEEFVMVLSKNEMHLYTGEIFLDPVSGKYMFVWRKINTYGRNVIYERIYYEDDAIFSGKLEYLWYLSGDYAVDELDRVYAGGANYYLTRLDGETFTVQAWTPVVEQIFNDSLEQVKVSRNPANPYLWAWEYVGQDGIPARIAGQIKLLNRETMANPFDATDNCFEFACPSGALDYAMAGDIDHGNGSLWVLWKTQSGATVHLSNLRPDGSRTDYDVTSELHSEMDGYAANDLMAFDDSNNQLIIGAYTSVVPINTKILFFSLDSMTLTGTITTLGPDTHYPSATGFKRGVVGNYLYFLRYADDKLIKVDVVNQTAEEVIDITSERPVSRSYESGIYVSYKESLFVGLIKDSINVHEVLFGRINPGSVYLDDVVSDICKRSGLEAADINVAQLSSDIVKGYCVSQDQSAREAIEPLMEAYIFDGVEVDGVLTFVKRGGASVATIPEADLAAHRLGEERPEPLEIEFADETELPRRLEVHYPDINRKHEAGVQHYQRQVTDSKLTKKIQTPILMDADQAKQLSHVAFKYFWTGKACTLSLGPKYSRMMPCDVVTIQKTEGDYRVLLLEAQREGLLTNWKGLIEEIDYTSTIEGTPAPAVDNDVFFTGPSIYYLLDLPPLLDAHDQAGVYMASGAMFSDWHGAEVFVSKDTGDTWTYLKSLASRAKTGVVTAALDDHEFVARDRHSAMTIRWDYTGDALATVTEAQLLQGQGHYLAIMKTDGDIEIVCARDVTTEADDSQTFENIIRGCKGTEYARTGHVTGEKVVLLNMNTIVLATLDATYLNQSYLYNGVSTDDDWEDGSQKIFTTDLNTLKPWSGVQAAGARDGSNNLTITWNRRNRIFGLNELLTGNEIPMSETSEAYEIDIYDGATVVRTISSLTDETASYTAAQQTADGLTPGDPVDCMIYQLSSVVGRGWPLDATV